MTFYPRPTGLCTASVGKRHQSHCGSLSPLPLPHLLRPSFSLRQCLTRSAPALQRTLPRRHGCRRHQHVRLDHRRLYSAIRRSCRCPHRPDQRHFHTRCSTNRPRPQAKPRHTAPQTCQQRRRCRWLNVRAGSVQNQRRRIALAVSQRQNHHQYQRWRRGKRKRKRSKGRRRLWRSCPPLEDALSTPSTIRARPGSQAAAPGSGRPHARRPFQPRTASAGDPPQPQPGFWRRRDRSARVRTPGREAAARSNYRSSGR